MSSTETGKEAEREVARLLKKEGHRIVELNWRTRWCEIDIVSTKRSIVYFTEVKFRKNNLYGSGFDYVRATKQKQMRFAAEFWLATNKWDGDAMLLAAEVSGKGEVNLVEI